MTESKTPVDVAVAFIEAFARHDMTAMARYVVDDIVFQSPQITLAGAEAVLEAIGQFGQVVIGVKILAALGDSEQAMIMYEMETGPFGTLRAVDHLVVRDGRIESDTLVFDTYEVRKAMAAQAPVGDK